MPGRARLVVLSFVSLALLAAPLGATAPPLDRQQAAARAVNRLEVVGAGFRLDHPRRAVDFTPEGVRLVGRRGAPEWTWSLVGIASSIGGELVEVGPVAPVADGPGLVRYDRCALAEEYRLKVDSVEQVLVIPEPLPLSGGDLVVVGAVRCEGSLASGPRGWQWRGPRGEVTMGDVTVLDAAGDTLPARLEVGQSRTRLVVDGAALATAAYPVVVDPELGSNDYRITDMGPDSDPDYDAFDPAVAYNNLNNTYLVVWQGDDFTGSLVEGEYEIFGQVLSGSTGSQTGYSDVRISFAGGTGDPNYNAIDPAVAFNSVYNQFLVVWSQDTDTDGLVDGEFEIWGQVVDPAIFPLDDAFRISTMGPDGDSAYDANRPAVTYNPMADEFLVVWDGDTNTGGLVNDELEIWAQRVYSTGVPVGSNLRMSDMGGTGDPAFDAFAADVAYNSRDFEYLVVWQGDDNTGSLVDDEVEVYAQLITWDGVGVGPNDARVSDAGGTGDPAYGAYAPAVAYNPRANEYLVVWYGDDDVGGLVDNEDEIFAQHMDADLNGLGPNDFRLTDVGGVGDATYRVMWGPDVAYSPILDQWIVVWSGEDTVDGMVNTEVEVFAQMLTGDATDGIGPNDERISDAGGLGEIACQVYAPVVAANTRNGQFLVAWGGEDTVGALVDGEEEIFIQRLDGMAIFVDGFESDDTSAWDAMVP